MATNGIVPREDNEGNIGTIEKAWSFIYSHKYNGIEIITPQMFYKESDGDDWTRALNAAADKCRETGTTLFIPHGVYNVSGVFDVSQINLVGDMPTFNLIAESAKLYTKNSSFCKISNIKIAGNYIATVGFEFDRETSGYCDNTLERVWILNCTYGLYANQNEIANRLLCFNCMFRDNLKYGVYIDSFKGTETYGQSTPIEFRNCVVVSNRIGGYYIRGAGNVTIAGGQVSDSIGFDSDEPLITVKNGYSIHVDNVDLESAKNGILFQACTNVSFTRTHIYNISDTIMKAIWCAGTIQYTQNDEMGCPGYTVAVEGTNESYASGLNKGTLIYDGDITKLGDLCYLVLDLDKYMSKIFEYDYKPIVNSFVNREKIWDASQMAIAESDQRMYKEISTRDLDYIVIMFYFTTWDANYSGWGRIYMTEYDSDGNELSTQIHVAAGQRQLRNSYVWTWKKQISSDCAKIRVGFFANSGTYDLSDDDNFIALKIYAYTDCTVNKPILEGMF